MNLTQELIDLQTHAQAKVPPEALALIKRGTEELIESGIVDRSLKVGDVVSDFALPNAVGNTIQLEQLLAMGPVVISFYRGQWCPFCNLELQALQQALPDIKASGASLVAISPQTPDNTLTTAQKHSLTFEVLSDAGNKVARQFGLVFQVPEYLRPVYQNFGVDLPAFNGDRTFELPIPATYAIAPDRRVAYSFVEPDYMKRLEPADIVTVLKGLKVAT